MLLVSEAQSCQLTNYVEDEHIYHVKRIIYLYLILCCTNTVHCIVQCNVHVHPPELYLSGKNIQY